MPALRFELISSERYGRRELAEVAGNQYPGGITTAGLYNVINSAQRPLKELGIFRSLGFRCGPWGLVYLERDWERNGYKPRAIAVYLNTRLGNRKKISVEWTAVRERCNGPVIRPVLRQYIANLMLF